ncbi:uncharacterized protein LOC125423052 isoform X1 [Ziziphus jujuba]|uniref:Uncharacterized protein LOC125423052 isoform X1 n=1 Tax=Ziziphus jujuba TaxID=326968 RepID=A0ABM3INH6_ZIZJJ|nr:uncharacterized protein LOC125423052 isoform X1 [Ziziphus jujuba]
MASLTHFSIGPSFISKKSLNAFSNISKSQPLNYQQKSRPNSSLFLSSRSRRKPSEVINIGRKSKEFLNLWRIWCNEDGSSAIPPISPPLSVKELIQEFYKAINDKDKEKVEELLSVDCHFHDLMFYDHFDGKENVAGFIHRAMDAMGPNIHAVITGVAEDEDLTASAIGHLEWKKIEIPFSTGCRFFECEEIEGKLFIRNITGVEELPLKPGDVVLKLLKTVSTLFDLYPLVAEGLLHGMKTRDTHHGLDMLLDMLRKGHSS